MNDSLHATPAPGPRGVPLLGSMPGFLRDPLGTILDGVREHGDVVRFRFGPFHFHVVNHPDYIRHVLQENAQNYHKSVNYDELRPLLGNGLLTSEGSFWLRQRRLASPAFHRQRVIALAETMTDGTTAMLDRWRALEHGHQTFDVAAEMMRLTLGLVGRTLFSADLSADADSVGAALTIAMRWANDRTTQLVRLPYTWPTPGNRKTRAAIATLDAMVFRIIEARRRDTADRGDLLSMLLSARDETSGDGMNDRQLRDEVMTLVLAGHETTANALSWTFYLLSKHPAVERRLHAEISEVLGDRVPKFEDLAKLKYTTMVLEESMRLYPPAWFIERQSIESDEVGGFTIPADSVVGVCPYSMHRHPVYWDNPEAFDPERFSPERSADRPRYVYIPFGGGPRVCIGNSFAMMEAQLILAMVVQRYRLNLVPGHVVATEPTVTLRPRHGVLMSLQARHDGRVSRADAIGHPTTSATSAD